MASCFKCTCLRGGSLSSSDSEDEAAEKCRREPPSGDMRSERRRLESLEVHRDLFPDISPAQLALQGFFRPQAQEVHGDEVECAFCHLTISSWDSDDDPVREHLRLSNKCPLLRGEDTENIPINEKLLQRLLKRVKRQYLSVRVSEYCQEEVRLKSFQAWPGSNHEEEKELALMGFFYTGKNWLVECIFCYMCAEAAPSVGDVLTRHLELAPGCPLVLGRAHTNVPLEPALYERVIYELSGQRASADSLVQPAEVVGRLQQNEMPRQDSQRRLTVISNPLSERYITVPFGRDLHMEKNRLSTFRYWRGSADKRELARCGFFYTGIEDNVQCIFCRVQMSNWWEDTDVLGSHMTRANCPLMRGLPTVNIPLDTAVFRYDDDQSLSSAARGDSDEEDDEKKCKICYHRNCDTVFLPCGHVVMCSECSQRVVDRCPICQQGGQVQKIFFV